MKQLEMLSLFSGIGAFEKALYNIGINYKLVGFSETDKYAIKSYCAIHNVDVQLNLGDITKIDIEELPRFIDIITHGSPCQDFSIAGKQIGGDVGTNTRSSLMWNTVDIVKWCLPKYVIWENVKNLLSKKHRHNFDSYLKIMEQLGYNNYYQVLNAKDYEIPQNRERVYTISIRKDIDEYNFVFPKKEKLKLNLKDMLESEVEERYFWNKKTIQELRKEKIEEVKYKWNRRVKDFIGDSRIKENNTYSLDAYNKNISYISQALTTPHNVNFILNNNRIRKLTPLEYWRLMRFFRQRLQKGRKYSYKQHTII